MKFFSTFRIRLLIILALLLVTTLSVQFYLNIRTQDENIQITEMREQALLAGFALGVNSISSGDRLADFVKSAGQSFYNEKTAKRIKDILIINQKWQINDSLSDKYLPTQDANGELLNLDLKDARDLPPLMEKREKLGPDIENFPNRDRPDDLSSDREAHAIPIETSEGRYYVMVILENDRKERATRAAQPVVYMLVVLLLSSFITFLLVWRFTRPIADLSKAAKRVAAGDLDFRLRDAARTDEIGELASQFNEMTSELKKTRELQAQLQEAEKSAVVGRFASAIAHEIRNPLNFINLTLDHLGKKFKPREPEQKETFEKLTSQVKTEIERINQQIIDFLRYSRPIKLDIKPTAIRNVIENSLRLVEPQAGELGIKLSVVERGEVPAVAGDAEILRSVFNNLFINGVQAMENRGGNLNVILSSDGEWVNIEVKDTGGGIAAENLTKIFEPYFSTKETGTGLGLAIAKKSVDDHRGKLSVKSEIGQGTSFTVTLPKAK